jgi:hypothetical protein
MTQELHYWIARIVNNEGLKTDEIDFVGPFTSYDNATAMAREEFPDIQWNIMQSLGSEAPGVNIVRL